MAAAFNLTAQINLRGPTNTRAIASQMRKQLSDIKVKVNLDLKGAQAKNVATLNKQLVAISRNAALANKNITNLSQSVNQLGAGLSKIGGGGTVQSLAKVQKQAASAGKSIDTATSQIQEFGKQSGLAIRRFAAFSAVTGVVYSLTNAINSAYKEFVQFDRQLIRLSQVTGTGIAGLKGITDEITRLSTNLGVASTDLLQVSVTLAQAGLSAQEAKTALEALAKSALAPSFDNLNDTVEGSIALMKQFSLSSGELEGALGSINAVAASFAVEAGDIIKAIQRTGGVFASASNGVSQGTDALNEFVALFTSVRATTREGAETIATGLRTIFTRIQRGSTIEALKEFGITLTDLEGKFVGPFEAIRRLSEGLQGLDPRDLRFGQIVEELGGFRQIGKVIPLIQQFTTAQRALAVAQGGQDSLAKNAIQAQLSLAIQFEKTRQSFVALVRDIGNSTTFRTIASVSLTTANAFISLTGALKPLLPMLTALAAIKGASILSEFGSGFLGGLGKPGGGGGGLGGILGGGGAGPKGGKGSGGRGGKSSSAALKSNTSALTSNTSALNSQISTMADLINTMQELSAKLSQAGGESKGFARGGLVPGSGNRDTVSAMLTPGEYVIRKKAVEKIGAENLEQLNKGGRVNKYARGGRVAKIQAHDAYDGDSWHVSYIPESTPVGPMTSRGEGYDAYEIKKGLKWERALGQKAKEIADKAFTDSRKMSNKHSMYDSLTQGQSVGGRPVHSVPDNIINEMVAAGVALRTSNKDNVATGYKQSEEVKKRQIKTLRSMGNQSLVYDRERSKFADGGGVDALAEQKGKSIQETLIDIIKENGGIKGIKKLVGAGGADRTLDSILRSNSIREASGSTLDQAISTVNKALSNKQNNQQSQQAKEDAAAAYGLVGLYGSPRDVIETAADGSTVKLVGRTLDRSLSDQYESMMIEGFEKTVSDVGRDMASKVGASTVSLNKNQMEKAGLYNAIGAYLEASIATLGAPYDKDESNDPLDFAGGLGAAAGLFNLPAEMPADTTRTVFGKGKSPLDFLGQVNRFRAKQAQKFAKGGEASDTVPALLTPGEYVINREAAKKLGSQKLDKLNKADKIQGYASGGAVGFVQRLAAGGGVEEDKIAYVGRMAQKLGLTIEQYEKTIQNRIVNQAEKRATTKGGYQADLLDVIVKNLESIGDADVEDVVRSQVKDLYEKIYDGYGELDPDLLNEGINEVIEGMKSGMSVEQLKQSSIALREVLNNQVTAGDELIIAQENMAKKLGFLTEGMKVKDIDLRAKQSLRSGKLGALDKPDLRGAQESIESGFGKILDDIGRKFSTANLPGMQKLAKSFPAVADKITMLGDKIGGLTGIIGTGATLLATQIPKMTDAFDDLAGTVSTHSETMAGLTGALQSGGSYGVSGAILGQQAFGRRGAAVGGAVGLAGGAVSGFIKESTAKELENAMRGVAEASSQLDKTFSRLDSARTIEERQDLLQQVNQDYQRLNEALDKSATEIENNRIWNALSSGLDGFLSGLTTVIGFMVAARAGSMIPMPAGGGKRGRGRKGGSSGGPIGFASGGMVPVKLAAGEGVFTPPLPTSESNLAKMNRADKNGYSPKFSGKMGIVPGNGPSEVDTFNTSLPEGSYVIRAKAMQAMAAGGGRIGLKGVTRSGYASGGSVQGYFAGGGVQGYAAGGIVAAVLRKAIVMSFKVLGPTLARSLGGIVRTWGPTIALTLGPAVANAISGFFDKTAQEQQLQAQIQALEELRKIADLQSQQLQKRPEARDRILNLMDPVESANLTAEQRQAEYASTRTRSGGYNELNILGELEAKSSLRSQGMQVGDDQSVQQYLDTLSGDDRAKAEQLVADANEKLAKRIYLDAKARESGMSAVDAEQRLQSTDPEVQREVAETIRRNLGIENRRIALNLRLATVNRELSKFTLNLTDVMNRLGSVMNRVTQDIIAQTGRLAQVSSEFSGDGASAAAGREDMSMVLGNITAYTSKELASVVDSINNSLGDTKETQQMSGLIKGLQVMQKELPLILRDTAEGGDINAGAETNIRSRLDKMFEGVDINAGTKDDLKDSIMNYITDETGARQGMSYEDLANNIEGLKELDTAAEKARQTFEDYANKQVQINNQLGNISNQLAGQLDKLRENVIKVRDIQLNSAIQLSEQFNRTLSLGDLNAPFQNRVSGLTGGITDPAKIGQEIAAAIAQKRSLESDPNAQTSALGAGQIAKLTSKINRYQRALDLLANSTDKASNALKKIDEQQRISSGRRSGVMDFLSNINNPEALLQMRQEQISYSNVMGGTGTVYDISEGIKSLRLAEQTQTPEDFARTQERFFQNAMTILEASGANPAVFRQFREMFSADFGPQDQNPAIKPFVDAYQQAIQTQTEAVRTQSGLIQTGAELARDALRQGADDFITKMKDAAAAVAAELNAVADRLGLGKPADANTLATGGVVYASAGQMINFQPKGTDTVPAMLTPGEFVVNRAATSKNLPLLKSINSGGYSGGGTVKYFDQGGYVSTKGGKYTGAQNKLDSRLEEDFNKVINDIADKAELEMVDTGYFAVQKNMLKGNRRITGKMAGIQSAMDFFNNLDRGLKSTDVGGDFRAIQNLDVFKETTERITSKDLQSILAKDNRLVSAINPYLKTGKENTWWSFFEGWGTENKKYQGNLSDASTTIETLGPKLDVYSDIMGKRIAKLPELQKIARQKSPAGSASGRGKNAAERRNAKGQIPKLQELSKRKDIIDGLIDMRFFGGGIEDVQSIQSLYGKDRLSAGYGRDISDLIDIGLLPEEILDKGFEEGMRKGIRNAAIGLAFGGAAALAPFTGGASLAAAGAAFAGTLGGMKLADVIEERQFQKLKTSDPLTYQKLNALRNDENFRSTAQTWEGLVDVADLAVAIGPGVAKFLSSRGSKLMKSVGKGSGTLGLIDDAVSPQATRRLDDILKSDNVAASPGRRGGTTGRVKVPDEKMLRMTPDIMELLKRTEATTGRRLADNFNKLGGDNLLQNTRDALGIMGIDPEDFYKVLPDVVKVSDEGAPGAIGYFRANQGRFNNMGEVAIKRAAYTKTLYHEMVHSMMDHIKKQRPEAWQRYQQKVKQVFSGNDPYKLADAIEAYSTSYKAPDMLFGRFYKAQRLQNAVRSAGSGTYTKITKTYPELKKFLDNPGNFNLPYDGATDAIMNGALKDLGVPDNALAWDAGAGMEEFLTKLVDNANVMSNKQRNGLGKLLDDLLTGPPPPPLPRDNSVLASLNTPSMLDVIKQKWKRFTRPLRRSGDDIPTGKTKAGTPDAKAGKGKGKAPKDAPAKTPKTTGERVKDFAKSALLYGVLPDLAYSAASGLYSMFGGDSDDIGGTAGQTTPGGGAPVPRKPGAPTTATDAAGNIIEQESERNRRMFSIINAKIMEEAEQTDSKGNVRYGFGQVIRATNIGLKDPLGLVDFLGRAITIPAFELGDSADQGVAPGELLTQAQREAAEAEYMQLNKDLANMYDGPKTRDQQAIIDGKLLRRQDLKNMLDSDYRAQFNLGVPKTEPEFNMQRPTKPKTTEPTDAERAMLKDSVIKDNVTLQELLSNQASGTATQPTLPIFNRLVTEFQSIKADKEANGASLALLNRYNKAKIEYVKTFGPVDGVSDQAIEAGLLSQAQAIEQVEKESKALEQHIGLRMRDKEFMSGQVNAQADAKQKARREADIQKMMKKYRQSGANSPNELKEWLQAEATKRKELKTKHAEWDTYYTKDKEYRKKQAEFHFLQQRWQLRDVLGDDPETRMGGNFDALEYILFNHPPNAAFGSGRINPFSDISTDVDEMLHGRPGSDVKAIMDPYQAYTQKAIIDLLNGYGKAYGIADPVSKDTNLDKWLEGIDPDAAQNLTSNVPNPGWMLDTLKNMYGLGMQADGKTLASKFGLWSVTGGQSAFNDKFAQEYQQAFIKKAYDKLTAVSERKGVEAELLPKDSPSTWEMIIDALNAYTSQMDPNIYRKGNAGFGPLRIAKANAGMSDADKIKQYKRDIPKAYHKYIRENFDYTYGGISSSEGFQKIADRFGLGLSGEELRETVLTDRNMLKRIREGYTSAVSGGNPRTSGQAKVSAGIANLFASAGSTQIDQATKNRFTDLDGNAEQADTILGLLSSSLDFGKRLGVNNRQSRIDYLKDFDFSQKAKGTVYEKYETDLDKNLEKLKPTYNLWDSLKSFFVQAGTTTAKFIDPSSFKLVTQNKTAGDSFKIGGKNIDAGSFIGSYEQALSQGQSAYQSIIDGASIMKESTSKAMGSKGASEFTLLKKPAPFGNKEFILTQKYEQLAGVNDPVDPVKKAQGGIISAKMFNAGGRAGGTLVNYAPSGTDTVPAMLTPGEFVVNRAATQRNLPLLKSINNGNSVGYRGGMSYAQSGGIIQARGYETGGLSAMGRMAGSALGFDTSSIENVFNTFVRSFSQETSAFGGLINNLARVFPALSGPVNNFGTHVDKLVKALDGLKTIEIKGPNIPDTINVNSETIRVELIAPQDTNYKLTEDDRKKITDSLETRLKQLTTLGR